MMNAMTNLSGWYPQNTARFRTAYSLERQSDAKYKYSVNVDDSRQLVTAIKYLRSANGNYVFSTSRYKTTLSSLLSISFVSFHWCSPLLLISLKVPQSIFYSDKLLFCYLATAAVGYM